MISIGWSLLANRYVLIAIGAAVVLAYAVRWGDNHGHNAARVAEIAAKLQESTARIKAWEIRDLEKTANAEKLIAGQIAKAGNLLKTSDKCIITPSMAEVLGTIQ